LQKLISFVYLYYIHMFSFALYVGETWWLNWSSLWKEWLL